MILRCINDVWCECEWLDIIRQVDDIRRKQHRIAFLAGKVKSVNHYKKLHNIWLDLQRQALNLNRPLALKLR